MLLYVLDLFGVAMLAASGTLAALAAQFGLLGVVVLAAITGVVCGVRVEDGEDPLMQKIRWLDKLIDELAKGKAMDKTLRQ